MELKSNIQPEQNYIIALGKKWSAASIQYHQKLEILKRKMLKTFKKHLDKWLRTVPDTPRIDDYGGRVTVDSNSIIAQAAEMQKKAATQMMR